MRSEGEGLGERGEGSRIRGEKETGIRGQGERGGQGPVSREQERGEQGSGD